MRLERHVGGVGKARQENYLRLRGWQHGDEGWANQRLMAEAQTLSRAFHHQLTFDLCRSLGAHGWQVIDYSSRGYARLRDPETGALCTVPKALRAQARREQRKTGELAYSYFLAAMTD